MFYAAASRNISQIQEAKYAHGRLARFAAGIAASPGDETTSGPFDKLTDRQRIYLRHVFQHRTSDEIAHAEGVSARAVDKQLLLAKGLLGATSRFEAARKFAEFEAGVERLYPASVAPSRPEFWPLPMPVPTKAKAINALTWKQILAWGVIIAIATPIALTVAAMVIVAFSLVIGINPQ